MRSNASAQLAGLSARLKLAGEMGVRREMLAGLRAAAKTVIPHIQEEGRESLPKSGGMNEYMAAKKPSVRIRTTGRQAGVSIRYKGKGSYSDEGGWRHPPFGHRDRKWSNTKSGAAVRWYERGAEKGTPEATAVMAGVLKAVAVQVQGRGL
jgi:hypothetical protein